MHLVLERNVIGGKKKWLLFKITSRKVFRGQKSVLFFEIASKTRISLKDTFFLCVFAANNDLNSWGKCNGNEPLILYAPSSIEHRTVMRFEKNLSECPNLSNKLKNLCIEVFALLLICFSRKNTLIDKILFEWGL